MQKQRFLVLLICCTHWLLTLAPTHASGLKILDVAVGLAKPPYIDQDNHSGFEIELVEQVMRPLGYRLNFLYVPYGRSQRMLQTNQVDLMLTAHDRLGFSAQKLSKSYVIYQNVAVTLSHRNINIAGAEDLSNYSLIAFQNAHLVLGKAFHDAIAQNPMYSELPEQRNQVEMLFLGKADVIVLDRNIFTYFKNTLPSTLKHLNVDIHPIFPENHYKVAFKDIQLKEKFNQSLALFIQSDDYALLQEKYALSRQLHQVVAR